MGSAEAPMVSIAPPILVTNVLALGARIFDALELTSTSVAVFAEREQHCSH